MRWGQRKYTAKDFKPGINIGLRHDTRATIDLDCPEAIKVAGRFLPPTDTSGKESTPDSHWWYEPVNGEPPYTKFTVTDNNTTILELRFGSNKQTVIPPSIHPNGERYVGRNGEGVYRWDAAEMERGVRMITTATLISRHLPKPRDMGVLMTLMTAMTMNCRDILRAVWDSFRG
jgi:putative DNA primase/helicase